ncbi:MAG: hypothetical protein AAB305_03080, partial [Candidatus Zixiibacteriota bacterium]
MPLTKQDDDAVNDDSGSSVEKLGDAPVSATPKSRQGRKRDKPHYIAQFPTLVDLVEHNGQPAFLVTNEIGLEITTNVMIDGQVCVPPPREKIPWELLKAEDVIAVYEAENELHPQAADKALFEDVKTHLKAVSELPHEDYYDLNAAWVLHTYTMENFSYSPIILLFGVPEMGKSRTGKGMIYLAYRGLHVESLREAYLLRVAQNLNATLFIDVMDVWKTAEHANTTDVLLSRFERGGTVPRVIFPDRGAFEDTVYYEVFGATIIGTNRAVGSILETRTIQINMRASSRRFDNEVTPALAIPLRLRLLAFRARHLGQTLPDIAKPCAGRLGDIIKPLFQIIQLVSPHRQAVLERLLKQIEIDRLADKAETFEAVVVSAILLLRPKVRNGSLPFKEITSELNKDKGDNYKVPPQKVGRTIKSLGIHTGRNTGTGGSAILWDEDQLE